MGAQGKFTLQLALWLPGSNVWRILAPSNESPEDASAQDPPRTYSRAFIPHPISNPFPHASPNPIPNSIPNLILNLIPNLIPNPIPNPTPNPDPDLLRPTRACQGASI